MSSLRLFPLIVSPPSHMLMCHLLCRSYFGLDNSSKSNAIQGATSGIYTGGGRTSESIGSVVKVERLTLIVVIGALVSSWVAERLGRKKAILVGALLATIGGALQSGSVAMAMFLVFRFVNGLGVGKSVGA